MDRKQLLWQMSAEQFAAFDIQLYLDTHPHDMNSIQLMDNYHKNYMKYKEEYEAAYGPLNPDSVSGGSWRWLDDPWPWERGAN